MRLLLLIALLFFTCSSLGQDSLRIDTTLKTLPATIVDSGAIDSISSTLTNTPVKKKKQRKQAQKLKSKNDTVLINEKKIEFNESSGGSNGFPYVGVLLIVIVIVVAIILLVSHNNSKQNKINTSDEGVISDDIKRMVLPRREYYRHVYLKSAAWKRKRYLVMKRDNWRCVYCGGRATQVHHLKYAKRNIGKEPIEWLVSICGPCHDAKH